MIVQKNDPWRVRFAKALADRSAEPLRSSPGPHPLNSPPHHHKDPCTWNACAADKTMDRSLQQLLSDVDTDKRDSDDSPALERST